MEGKYYMYNGNSEEITGEVKFSSLTETECNELSNLRSYFAVHGDPVLGEYILDGSKYYVLQDNEMRDKIHYYELKEKLKIFLEDSE